MNHPFTALLERSGFVLFDGAIATELERKGHDLSGPLWSGRLLSDDERRDFAHAFSGALAAARSGYSG